MTLTRFLIGWLAVSCAAGPIIGRALAGRAEAALIARHGWLLQPRQGDA